MQKRDLAPAPGDHQHLRGVDEKRAGEQGDQRERRQVRAISTRQTQRVVARLPRCQEPRPGRQDGGNRAARGRQVAARHEPQVDAIHAAEPREALLRLRDVEHADLLTKGAGRQEASHPQALRLESDLDAELVALLEVQRFRGRGAQPDRTFGEHPGGAHRGRAQRRERRLQLADPERVDAEQLQRAAAIRQTCADIDDGTCDRDHRQLRERRVKRLVETLPGSLHGQVRDPEQAARRELHFVCGDAIDEMHRQPERDTERDRHHRDRRASRRLSQWSEDRGREPQPPRRRRGSGSGRRGQNRHRS